MASQYQIYEASLTGMCNMYRYANDSEESFAFGELANKIKNFHKDPIYPEGCSIIKYISTNGTSDEIHFERHSLSERPSDAVKISLDGSADTYGFWNNDSKKYCFYSDNDIYLSRYPIFSFYSIPIGELTDYVNTQFFKGEWHSYGTDINLRPCYNLGANIYNFPNIRSIVEYNTEIIESSKFHNWVNNSKLTYMSLWNKSDRPYNIIPRYAIDGTYGSIPNNCDVNLPSTFDYFAYPSANPRSIVFQSPFYKRNNLSEFAWGHQNFNIQTCEDLIIGPQAGSWSFGYSNITFNTLKNIYIMPNANCFYEFNMTIRELNIKGFNNEPIKMKSMFTYGNTKTFINIQDDVFLVPGYYSSYPFYGTLSGELTKLPHVKNIYSQNYISSNFHTNFNQYLETGFFAEGIYSKNNIFITTYTNEFKMSNLKTSLVTINDVIYSKENISVSFHNLYCLEDNYKLRLYAENQISFDTSRGGSTNIPIKGDLYIWANNYNNSSITIGCSIDSKFNIHIRRGSMGEYESSDYHNCLNHVHIFAQNYAGGSLISDNCLKVGDGHYVERNYGLIHIYEHDTCPFEVNKEFLNHDW